MTAPRATRHLTLPPTPGQLRGRFPSRVLPTGTPLYRNHPQRLGPWWFGSSLAGRFDLSEPAGTCYTAESEIVTLLETWTGIALIPQPELDQRALSTMTADQDLQLADMTSNAAIGFGVTAEISTTIDYDLTQNWATALHAAGYNGIRYWARHEVGRTAACVALFDFGGAPRDDAPYLVRNTTPLSECGQLWEHLRQQTGIEVADIPDSL